MASAPCWPAGSPGVSGWPLSTGWDGSLWFWLDSPLVQILAIRGLRDVLFIHGSSVGFYPTLAYTFLTIAPYCLVLGFVLPYSLFAIRTENPDYPGTRIYIIDNLGDVSGGALFSFVLVFLVTPLKAVFLANLPLLAGNLSSFSTPSLGIILLFIWGPG